MRRKLLVCLLVLLLFSAISLVHASEWISGQVNTVPAAKTYSGAPYFEFGFTVTDTNGTLSGNLTCDVPYALVLSQLGSISLGTAQNMTGDRVINGSLPVGNFLVTNFISSGNSTGWSLSDALRYIWTLLGSVGSLMVSYLQYFTSNTLHVEVPTVVMNFILLIVIGLIWWYVRRLPIFVSLILFVVCIGLAGNLATAMHLTV